MTSGQQLIPKMFFFSSKSIFLEKIRKAYHIKKRIYNYSRSEDMRNKKQENKKCKESLSLFFITYSAIEWHPVKHANVCIECQLHFSNR